MKYLSTLLALILGYAGHIAIDEYVNYRITKAHNKCTHEFNPSLSMSVDEQCHQTWKLTNIETILLWQPKFWEKCMYENRETCR